MDLKYIGILWLSVNVIAIGFYFHILHMAIDLYWGTVYGVFVFGACAPVFALIVISMVENIRTKWWQKIDQA